MLPVRLHFVISRLLAGGSLGFRIVLSLIPGSQISVWHSCGLVDLLFLYLCHTNLLVIQRYHLSCTLQGLSTDRLITNRAVLFLVVLFVLFLLIRCLLSCYSTVTAQWIVYRSNSVLF